MRYYDITVLTSKPFKLAVDGDYFRYYAGNAGGSDESILVKGVNTGTVVLLKPGQSVRLPKRETTWELSNYAGSADITGLVVIGDGQVNDDRITGEVSVINGELSRVLAGKSFFGSVLAPAVAGQYSYSQLYNPNAVNLIVRKIGVFSGVAGSAYLRSHNAALAGSIDVCRPKLVGGSVGSENMNVGSTAATVGTFVSFMYVRTDMSFLEMAEPLVVPPGQSIIVQHLTVNASLYSLFDYYKD